MKLRIRYMRGLWHVMNADNIDTIVNSNSLAGLLDYIYSFGEDYD